MASRKSLGRELVTSLSQRHERALSPDGALMSLMLEIRNQILMLRVSHTTVGQMFAVLVTFTTCNVMFITGVGMTVYWLFITQVKGKFLRMSESGRNVYYRH